MTLCLVLASTAIAVIVFVIGALGWYVWELHPWVPAGQAFALGAWHFGDYEFEAWQRKNVSLLEPFSDGLYVRRGTNQWQAFCFDIQDSYSPKLKLQRKGAYVIVYCNGEKRGVYDMERQVLQRHRSPTPPTRQLTLKATHQEIGWNNDVPPNQRDAHEPHHALRVRTHRSSGYWIRCQCPFRVAVGDRDRWATSQQ